MIYRVLFLMQKAAKFINMYVIKRIESSERHQYVIVGKVVEKKKRY